MNNTLIKDIPAELERLQNKLLDLRKQGKLFIQNGDVGYSSAPSNIALLKYWGKETNREQIPLNSSLSYTIGGFRSFTKVTALGRFLPNEEKTVSYFKNKLFLDENSKENKLPPKMDRLIRSILFPFAEEISIEINSHNNFPTACGIASSASGYAALVGAIADLLQLEKHFSKLELLFWLSEWARLGSGSATRSVFTSEDESFVKWESPILNKNKFTNTSSVKFHPKWRQLQHSVFVLNSSEKQTSSSDGHKYAQTSPLNTIRTSGITHKLKLLQKALLEFDFECVQSLTEEDAYSMHAVMQTGEPKACYLTNEVSNLIGLFIQLRNEYDVKAFWTLDAGPNIHILYMPEAKTMLQKFHEMSQTMIEREIKILTNSFNEGLLIGKNSFNRVKNINTLESYLK
jgi:diphosphomevalonate decarboxylase